MRIKYTKTSDWNFKGEAEIFNLEDLQNFRKTLAKGEEVIISRWSSDKDDIFELEIYNTYGE
jgi:hypothetical protein